MITNVLPLFMKHSVYRPTAQLQHFIRNNMKVRFGAVDAQ